MLAHFVRGLGLKSYTEWSDYCKSGKKPADIPTDPRSNLRGSWLGRIGRLARDWQGRSRPISVFQEGPRVRARPRFEI